EAERCAAERGWAPEAAADGGGVPERLARRVRLTRAPLRLAQGEQQLDAKPEIALRIQIEREQRLLQQRHRLLEGEPSHGAVCSLLRIPDGLPGIGSALRGLAEVVGELAQVGVGVARAALLEDLGNARMQPGAFPRRYPVAQGLADDAVGEAVAMAAEMQQHA